jgi:DNA-binding transcriptional ArsR family regulator
MSKVVLPIELTRSQDFAEFFLALGNESRLRIMLLLNQEPNLTVSDIALKANISLQRISDHLSILRRRSLLTFTKEGRNVHYLFNKQLLIDTCRDSLSWLGVDLDAYQAEPKQDVPLPVQEKILKLLSSEGRCLILEKIKDKELTVNEIQSQIFLEQQTVSDHLQLMKKASFISTKQEGRFVKSILNRPALALFFKVFIKNFA